MLNLNEGFVFCYPKNRPIADLFKSFVFCKMELVLVVIFVPLEILAKSLVEYDILLELSTRVITEIPGFFISNPNLANRLQIFIEFQQVSELISTSSNNELAHNAQKGIFTLMMV
jgi:hypothetical protein